MNQTVEQQTNTNIERCVNYYMDPRYSNNYNQSEAEREAIGMCCYLTIKNQASNVEDCVNYFKCGQKFP